MTIPMTMTTPLFCLLLAVMLPYMIAGSSIYFRLKQFGRIDLNQPRAQAAQLEGYGARVNAAQYNAWEALVVFATALLVADMSNVSIDTMTQASLIFVAARILHAFFYITDQAILRSTSFVVGFGACIWLFVEALS